MKFYNLAWISIVVLSVFYFSNLSFIEELIDDTFDIPNNSNVNIETNVIELKDDLKTKTTNLSYEKYDYDSDIIPLHPMKKKIKPVHC